MAKAIKAEHRNRVQQNDLVGLKFGRWTVERIADRYGRQKVKAWFCLCECGVSKVVTETSLLTGFSKSCGCYKKDAARRQMTTHGMRNSPEFTAWDHMIARCTNTLNPHYHNYGGRGISVCETWRTSFVAFLTDMGHRPTPGHSLDRIDNDGNYNKDNCRWATYRQQQNNKRTNHILTCDGVSLSMTEWAEKAGMPRSTLARRISSGWPVDIALKTAVRRCTK